MITAHNILHFRILRPIIPLLQNVVQPLAFLLFGKINKGPLKFGSAGAVLPSYNYHFYAPKSAANAHTIN